MAIASNFIMSSATTNTALARNVAANIANWGEPILGNTKTIRDVDPLKSRDMFKEKLPQSPITAARSIKIWEMENGDSLFSTKKGFNNVNSQGHRSAVLNTLEDMHPDIQAVSKDIAGEMERLTIFTPAIDQSETFAKRIGHHFASYLNGDANIIAEGLASNDGPSVFTTSQGVSIKGFTAQMIEYIAKLKASGTTNSAAKESYNSLNNEIFSGNIEKLSVAERDKQLVRYVEKSVTGSSEVQQAKTRYVNLVQQAKGQKRFVVVAASNDRNLAPELDRLITAGSELNIAAQPGTVIVAASDGRGKSQAFSSRGTGEQKNIFGDQLNPSFMVNDTTLVPVSRSSEKSNEIQLLEIENGTSLAAPKMAVLLGLLRAKYPEKSNDEILTILQKTAINGPEPIENKGQGLVQPDLAMKA